MAARRHFLYFLLLKYLLIGHRFYHEIFCKWLMETLPWFGSGLLSERFVIHTYQLVFSSFIPNNKAFHVGIKIKQQKNLKNIIRSI